MLCACPPSLLLHWVRGHPHRTQLGTPLLGTKGDLGFQAVPLQGRSAEPGLDLAHGVPSVATYTLPGILGPGLLSCPGLGVRRPGSCPRSPGNL